MGPKSHFANDSQRSDCRVLKRVFYGNPTAARRIVVENIEIMDGKTAKIGTLCTEKCQKY